MGLAFSEKAESSYVEKSFDYLFQPDTVLPIQYFERLRRNIYLQSEKRLMFAVLEDAVACFQKYHSAPDKGGKALFQEVDEWFASKDDNWFFSFENICEALAINSDYFRRGLREWEEKQLAPRALGSIKETKKFGKKTRVRRKAEKRRVSAMGNHEVDGLEALETDFQCLRFIHTATNEDGRSMPVGSG